MILSNQYTSSEQRALAERHDTLGLWQSALTMTGWGVAIVTEWSHAPSQRVHLSE